MSEEDLPFLNLPIKEIVKENEIAVESDYDFLLSLSFQDIDKILKNSGFYFFEIPNSEVEVNKNKDETKSIYVDDLGNVLLLEYKFGIIDVETDFGTVSLSGIHVYRRAELFLNVSNGLQRGVQEVDLGNFLENCAYTNVAYDLPTRIKKLFEENNKSKPENMYV